MESLWPLLFVAIMASVVAGVLVAWRLKQKRREELAYIALQLGMRYSPEDALGCLELPFALFRKGDGRGVENVLWGTWQGRDVREFDYWYYEESTDSNGHTTKTYSRFSCAVTPVDAACSPLKLERENPLTWLANHAGFHDIEFESEGFNDAFDVRSPDPKFANDLIDARMMEWLLTTETAFEFEICDTWVLCYSRKRPPMELIPLLGTLKGFVEHVPKVVFELYGTGARPLGS